MKDILKLIKAEFKYLWFSKIILALYIFFTAIICISLFSNTSQLKQKYELYNTTYNNYLKNGEDPILALQQETNIIESDEVGNTTIQNPLRYDYNNVCKFLSLTNPNYVMIQSLEFICFVICTIVFGFLGVYVSTFDHKWKTLKLKAARDSVDRINVSKVVSSFGVVLIIIFSSVITSFIIGSAFYFSTISNMDLSVFKFEYFSSGKLPIAFCFVIFVSMVFFVIGYTLGILFKKPSIPAVIILLYNLVVPSLGKYDLKNSISTIGHEIFKFHGDSALIIPSPMTLTQANISLIVITFILLFAIYIVSNKQSKFAN